MQIAAPLFPALGLITLVVALALNPWRADRLPDRFPHILTWRATKMRTKSGNLVIVPNSVVSKDTITNYSQPTNDYRLEIDVGVSYDSPPNEVKTVIIAALAEEPLLAGARTRDVASDRRAENRDRDRRDRLRAGRTPRRSVSRLRAERADGPRTNYDRGDDPPRRAAPSPSCGRPGWNHRRRTVGSLLDRVRRFLRLGA